MIAEYTPRINYDATEYNITVIILSEIKYTLLFESLLEPRLSICKLLNCGSVVVIVLILDGTDSASRDRVTVTSINDRFLL